MSHPLADKYPRVVCTCGHVQYVPSMGLPVLGVPECIYCGREMRVEYPRTPDYSWAHPRPEEEQE